MLSTCGACERLLALYLHLPALDPPPQTKREDHHGPRSSAACVRFLAPPSTPPMGEANPTSIYFAVLVARSGVRPRHPPPLIGEG